ncbi:MAG: site-specific DNA-methyltransferase [Bacteroidaceae bacterium]|nr:site-specific DNA-methyltransferase [Bacteroidaceae bacterium]MEA5018004.1 site-specific DNA-methyltransferase [Erysipelotrichaceae bacterium]
MLKVLNNCLSRSISFYYEEENVRLLFGDSFYLLKKIKPDSIDCIFADPPYFLSNGGISVHAGKQVLVNKGEWDEGFTLKEKHQFNRKWIRLCKRALNENGTIWISGTMHNIYSVGYALEQEGFKILNNITWQKLNPPPNLACRCFTHSTETIIWAKKDTKKSKQVFNYNLMKGVNDGRQMKDVWSGPLTNKKEKMEGKHPTQKPEYLLERIIKASTKDGDIVLDPFNGSGTTGVVAKRFGRKYIGIDNCEEYLEIAKRRIKKEDLKYGE